MLSLSLSPVPSLLTHDAFHKDLKLILCQKPRKGTMADVELSLFLRALLVHVLMLRTPKSDKKD